MTIPRASDCYTYSDNDPLHGNAHHVPTDTDVEVFLVLRYESGRVAVVGSKVPGSFNTEDFVNGDVGDFKFEGQQQ